MKGTRVHGVALVVSVFLGVLGGGPQPARAAWVNSTATQFQVGGSLVPAPIVPTANTTVDNKIVDPSCATGTQGTSIAIVQGSKLAGVDPVAYPVLLVVSCLSNTPATAEALNFLDPKSGKVIKQISTTTAPSSGPAGPGGWAHLVHRPDQGNLLGCGNDGSIYSIAYSQFDTSQQIPNPATAPTLASIGGGALPKGNFSVVYTYTAPEGETGPSPAQLIAFKGGGIQVTAAPLPVRATGIAVYINGVKQGVSATNVFTQTSALVVVGVAPPVNTTGGTGTVTPVLRPAGLPASCVGLAWVAEQTMIYQVFTGGLVNSWVDGTNNPAVKFSFGTPCPASGLAISGGVLLVECAGVSTIDRLDKTTGTMLGVNGTLGILGMPAGTPLNPGLGDLACDPATFQKDAITGQDLYTDALWSRQGTGNGLVPLEFPAFTCGLDSSSVVGGLSPLAPGLSAPAGGQIGAVPEAACFDSSGRVRDTNGDGLPDCWKDGSLWPDGQPGIDFGGGNAGGRVRDFVLCVQVDTTGSGVANTKECASKLHKDIFVEIDYMQGHPPDPLALSQPQPFESIGVQSVREAFRAAPLATPNPDGSKGISIHFQVNEQVTFTTLAGTQASVVDFLAFAPCTGPASFVPAVSQSDAADFHTIKRANFGTAADRAGGPNTLNAKRLAFHYMLFAHNQVGQSPGTSSTASGCSEVPGPDSVITLGSFAQTSVTFGTTDQQAGTVMHELGHNLGLRHGGGDNINCKPNYRSVMNYTRQFAGSPIPNRRLDYSRAVDADLNKSTLNDNTALGLGGDPSLGPLAPAFPSADQTAFGPNAWTVAPAQGAIDWDRGGTDPGSGEALNINLGPGCDGSGTVLGGHNDWQNLLFRFSATLDFAAGQPTASQEEHVDLTSEAEQAFFQSADLDGNGVADAQDCGSFLCTHRISIMPGLGTTVSVSQEGNFQVAIFSETNGTDVWDAVALVDLNNGTLRFNGIPVKLNHLNQGTCHAEDIPDPVTGQTDGIKDLVCQFPVRNLLPLGTQYGVVTGVFFNATGGVNAFRARQLFTIVP
jgi:hypothetical protein